MQNSNETVNQRQKHKGSQKRQQQYSRQTNPPVANAIGEIRNFGKAITMIAVDWDIDADASRIAMEALHNTIMTRATI